MRLLLAGDTHSNTNWCLHLLRLAKQRNCDAVFQLGDFGFRFKREEFIDPLSKACHELGIKWYWIDGNHDNHDFLEEVTSGAHEAPIELSAFHANDFVEIWPYIYYCPRGHSWEWDGVKFLGLGGAFSVDKSRRSPHISWWPQETITPEQVNRAISAGKVDILLSHDCPNDTRYMHAFFTEPQQIGGIWVGGWKNDEASAANRACIDAVIDATQPKAVVHGHMHVSYHEPLLSHPDTEVFGLAHEENYGSYIILDIQDGKMLFQQ